MRLREHKKGAERAGVRWGKLGRHRAGIGHPRRLAAIVSGRKVLWSANEKGPRRGAGVPVRAPACRRRVRPYSAAIFCGWGMPSTGQPVTPMESRVMASTICCARRGSSTQVR